ncbi:hypothetical protein WJX77_012096 [Trebouxia sp. C0004]
MERNLATCTSADMLVYMGSHWLPNHAGTLLPDGSMIASPDGVSGCLSHLFTGFMLIGRLGDWDHSTSTGNPVVSTDLTQYRKGYKMQAWRPGRFSCANQQQKSLSAGGSFGAQHADLPSWATTAPHREGHHVDTADVGDTTQG